MQYGTIPGVTKPVARLIQGTVMTKGARGRGVERDRPRAAMARRARVP